MAKHLRRRVTHDHPDYGMVVAAYTVNLISLILGLVGIVVMTIILALYFGAIINVFQHTH